MKFERVVFEIRERTDRQTDTFIAMKLCAVNTVAEEDCDPRSALVTAQTTDKKKGLLRGLLRLGKLAKKDAKPSTTKQAPASSVKRKPASPLRTTAVCVSQRTERPPSDTPREPA